jgi:HAE1 family hydrophobic/amphiphilic exporter-1
MKLAETCVKYPVFTVMLIAFLVTLGVFSYRGLAVDLFPKADPATINVEVKLPGATPEEVVTGVVLPLEDAISSVSGIDEISVYSSEGFADITCTFVLERDIEGAAQDIREKVAGAIDRLPRDTLPPVITKLDPQSDPILTLLVSGPIPMRELTEIATANSRVARCTKANRAQFHGIGCSGRTKARKHRSAWRPHDYGAATVGPAHSRARGVG